MRALLKYLELETVHFHFSISWKMNYPVVNQIKKFREQRIVSDNTSEMIIFGIEKYMDSHGSKEK